MCQSLLHMIAERISTSTYFPAEYRGHYDLSGILLTRFFSAMTQEKMELDASAFLESALSLLNVKKTMPTLDQTRAEVLHEIRLQSLHLTAQMNQNFSHKLEDVASITLILGKKSPRHFFGSIIKFAPPADQKDEVIKQLGEKFPGTNLDWPSHIFSRREMKEKLAGYQEQVNTPQTQTISRYVQVYIDDVLQKINTGWPTLLAPNTFRAALSAPRILRGSESLPPHVEVKPDSVHARQAAAQQDDLRRKGWGVYVNGVLVGAKPVNTGQR